MRSRLLAAVWAGLLAGLLEIAMVQFALRAGVPVRLSADYLWMAPAANLGFALTALLIVTLIGRWFPAFQSTPVVAGVLVAIPVLSVGLGAETLHRGAVLLLAAGIGAAAGRMADKSWARRLFPVILVTGLAMAGLTALLAISSRVALARAERSELAALPAAPAGALNVLLLILDTVREQSTGLGDSTLATTPALDAFAKRGVTFERAFAPAPWTLPSHASFFTGRLPPELSANWGVPLDRRAATLAEVLGRKGYLAGGFVGNLEFVSRASGLARGFIHYEDYPVSGGQLLLSSSIGRALASTNWLRRLIGYHELLNRRTARQVSDDFLRWQARVSGRPFFAFLNLFDAHEPYFPSGRPSSFLWQGPLGSRYEHEVGLHSGANAWVARKWTLKPEEAAVLAGAYHQAIARQDAQVGRLLAELEHRGVLASTLVIIAGDHGEQLGEHRLFEHINSLYLPALEVPLVIVAPRVPQGLRVPATVSLRDIPATVTDLLGLSADAPFPGRSLAAHWAGPAPADTVFSVLRRGLVRQEWYPIGRGQGAEMFSLVTPEHHYIRNPDNSEELYDLTQDPAELDNRAKRPAELPVLTRFRGGLDRLMRSLRP